MMSFDQLETRYGYTVAYDLLLQIEKVARIQSWAVVAVDPETRIANALRIQDAMAVMPMQMAA
jgi:hypothetical protein